MSLDTATLDTRREVGYLLEDKQVYFQHKDYHTENLEFLSDDILIICFAEQLLILLDLRVIKICMNC